MSLIECVPNFSEGRREPIMREIIAAVQAFPVHLLDWSADADHNRMVVTFAGEPSAVTNAMFNAAAAAVRLIDMEAHTGVHPCIGAVDVIPFIPLREATMAECVTWAHTLGQRIASELHIPVYMYEETASTPVRRNLAYHRRGGYAALKQEVGLLADRAPDYGEPVVGKAGAVAVGARAPLIAFNLYLDTDQVEIARQIAHAIRESSGGLPYVKALGLLVKGRAQVSINVIDYRKTSLHAIMNAVRAAASRFEVRLLESELIGLIPQAALLDYALADLLLPTITREQILETRLGRVTNDYRELSFE